jgi:hypothetical protein
VVGGEGIRQTNLSALSPETRTSEAKSHHMVIGFPPVHWKLPSVDLLYTVRGEFGAPGSKLRRRWIQRRRRGRGRSDKAAGRALREGERGIWRSCRLLPTRLPLAVGDDGGPCGQTGADCCAHGGGGGGAERGRRLRLGTLVHLFFLRSWVGSTGLLGGLFKLASGTFGPLQDGAK